MVSAVKIGGERLYKRARNGEIIERPARPICIHEFAFLNLATPDVQFRVRCSSGTYVRSLCHDVGQRLGCGAALASLRRTRIGRHRIEDAVPLEHVKTPEDIRIKLVPMEAALDLPRVCVDGEDRHRIVTGNMVIVPDLCHNEDDRVGWVQIVGPQGELVALGQVDRGFAGEGSVGIQPKRVFVENK